MALVIGLLQSGLAIIYVSIGCSVVAGVLLAVAVVRGKPERVSSGPMPKPVPPPAPASQSWESPQPAVQAERESQREPAMAGAGGAPAAPDETEQLDQAAIELAVRGDEHDGPIPDYDRLRATEVLPLLADLDAGELAQVRAQEAAGRNRFMVLSRIDRELEARGPAEAAAGAEATEGGWDSSDDWDRSEEAGADADEGADEDEPAEREPAAARASSRSILDNYEQLKVLEILPRLGELNADELAQVRRREQTGQRRAMIINRVDRLIVDARPAAAARPTRAARPAAPAPPARRGPARTATANKAPARKAPAKKAAPTKVPAKKVVAKKVVAKAPPKKAAVRKATKATKATKKR
ncbi:MAG: hypothetical protein M3Z84_03535 [Actinomycetota bacterium]|nr:hypothetical protein [Actinomycetota bacterium]